MKINKPTYTPGPWKVEGYKFSKRGKSYEHPAAVIAGNIWIASKIGGHDLCDSSMANARLIAAAPEMMGALRTAWAALDAKSLGRQKWSGKDQSAFEAITAAILKAEGK